jgi:hypothetical protein
MRTWQVQQVRYTALNVPLSFSLMFADLSKDLVSDEHLTNVLAVVSSAM